MRRHALILLVLSALTSVSLAGLSSCSCEDDRETGTPTTEAAPAELQHGLTSEQAAETLAKIGERTITVGEFAEELASKGPYLQAQYSSPERRRELLDQMIRFELLAQEADRTGYDERPDVARTRKQVLIRRFLKQEYEDRIHLDDISDEDVRAYYESHQTEFHKPEQVRASHIQIADRATAQRVLREILAAPNDTRLFRSLAERHNQDANTRDRFGDLRFFSRPEQRQADEPEVPPEVATAAFSIATVGNVHPELVRSAQGFHIVKLTGRRAALDRSLEDATRPIRHRLWRERREHAVEELVQRLRGEADVQEDLSLLSEVHIDIPEGDLGDEPLPPEAADPLGLSPGMHAPGMPMRGLPPAGAPPGHDHDHAPAAMPGGGPH